MAKEVKQVQIGPNAATDIYDIVDAGAARATDLTAKAPTSMSITNGTIALKNSAGTTLCSAELPIYGGEVA